MAAGLATQDERTQAHVRLIKEDAAAWEAYGQASRARAEDRGEAFDRALATLDALMNHEARLPTVRAAQR